MTSVRFRKLFPAATEPTKATEQSAGFDLYTHEALNLNAWTPQIIKVNTGIALEILKEGIYARVVSRSGLAAKGLVVIAGVIDPDYRGPVYVLLQKIGREPLELESGSRIAQIIFEKYEHDVVLEETTEFHEPTTRGYKGLGSSGV